MSKCNQAADLIAELTRSMRYDSSPVRRDHTLSELECWGEKLSGLHPKSSQSVYEAADLVIQPRQMSSDLQARLSAAATRAIRGSTRTPW
jgi:hypothetical protein